MCLKVLTGQISFMIVKGNCWEQVCQQWLSLLAPQLQEIVHAWSVYKDGAEGHIINKQVLQVLNFADQALQGTPAWSNCCTGLLAAPPTITAQCLWDYKNTAEWLQFIRHFPCIDSKHCQMRHFLWKQFLMTLPPPSQLPPLTRPNIDIVAGPRRNGVIHETPSHGVKAKSYLLKSCFLVVETNHLSDCITVTVDMSEPLHGSITHCRPLIPRG